MNESSVNTDKKEYDDLCDACFSSHQLFSSTEPFFWIIENKHQHDQHDNANGFLEDSFVDIDRDKCAYDRSQKRRYAEYDAFACIKYLLLLEATRSCERLYCNGNAIGSICYIGRKTKNHKYREWNDRATSSEGIDESDHQACYDESNDLNPVKIHKQCVD